MQLEDLLKPANVLVDLDASDPMAAISSMLQHFETSGDISDRESLVDIAAKLFQREQTLSFGNLPGAALPHLATASVKTDILIVARLSNRIRWGTKNPEGIRLVFLYLQPRSQHTDLRILASLYAFLNDKSTLHELEQCTVASDLYSFIMRIGVDLDAPDGLLQHGRIRVHEEPMMVLSVSHDDALVATADASDQFEIAISRIADVGDLKVLGRLAGHSRFVTNAAWHPSRHLLASASSDKTVRLWDLDAAHGEVEHVVPEVLQLGVHTHMVSWSSDGSMLAAAAHELGARIWSIDPLEVVAPLNLDNVLAVSWAPNRSWLVASYGRFGNSLCIWDVSSGKVVHDMKVACGVATSLAWQQPDGAFLAVGGLDGPIEVFESGTWRRTRLNSDSGDAILDLQFSPNGKYLAAKSRDGYIILRSTATWQEIARFREPCPLQELSAGIAFTASPNHLITDGGHGGTMRIWEITDDRLGRTSRLAAAQSTRSQSLPDGLVTSVRDGHAILFAGAGCSIPALELTTDDLVNAIAKRVVRDIPGYDHSTRRPEDVFDEFSAIVDLRTLQADLSALVPSRCDSPAHFTAVQLFRRIITTNWDELFEHAFDTSGMPFTLVVDDADTIPPTPDNRSLLIKMHGTRQRPGTLVATASQFSAYHLTHKRLMDRVRSELQGARPVFVGYGLRDEHVRRILALIAFYEGERKMLGYAIGFYDEARSRLLAKHGIETIQMDVENFMRSLSWSINREAVNPASSDFDHMVEIVGGMDETKNWDSIETVTVTNRPHLHARPYVAVQFTACEYSSTIELVWGERNANAKSVTTLMENLGAVKYGEPITIRARGNDASAAASALAQLIRNRCGERSNEEPEGRLPVDVFGALDERCIDLELAAETKEDAIRSLCDRLADRFKFTGRDDILAEAVEKEKAWAFASGIGEEVAIPHASPAKCTRLCVAFGRPVRPIEWKSIDKKPVSLIFMTLAPPDAEHEKQALLLMLCKCVEHASVRDELREAKDAAQVLAILRSFAHRTK